MTPTPFKATEAFTMGQTIAIVSSFTVEGPLLVAEDAVYAHGFDYNAILLGKFIVAVKNIPAGVEVTLNFNQFCYELSQPFEWHGVSVRGFRHLPCDEMQELYKFAADEVRDAAVADGFLPRTQEKETVVTVRDEATGSIIATAAVNISVGQNVFTSTGITVPLPLRNTVAMADGTHLRLTGGTEFLAHSCQPNIVIGFVGTQIQGTAIRPIKIGEKLTYNYLTTEWDIACPFRCSCSMFCCYGLIQGFRHLDDEQKCNLLPYASEWVRANHERTKTQPDTLLSNVDANRLVAQDAEGKFIAAREITPGTVLFHVSRYEVVNKHLVIEDLQLQHSCDASAVFVEGRIVARKLLTHGDAITVNLSLMLYKLPEPFECSCGTAACTGTVRGFCGLSDDAKDALMNLAEPSVRVDATLDGYTLRSSSPLVAIRGNGNMGQSTFAARAIAKGTKFFHTEGLVLPFPTMYTILLDENKHLLFAGGAQCLAHSCDPNVQVLVNPDEQCFDVLALRDIAEGELIAFNYLTTEFDLASPFPCLCGAARCFHMIRGYLHLNADERALLEPQVTPVLKRLVRNWKTSSFVALTEVKTSSQNSNIKVRREPHLVHEAVVPSQTKGLLETIENIRQGLVLIDCKGLTLTSDAILVGSNRIPHEQNSTTVLVEGRLVSRRDLTPGETLTVNMNYFVYDLAEALGDDGVSVASDGPRGFKHIEDEEKQRMLFLCEPPVRARAMKDGFVVKSTSPLLYVQPNGDMGQTAYATAFIPSGTRLFHATGLLVPFITMYTICVGRDRHLLFGDAAECIAHSCDPNVQIVLNGDNTFDMVTIRDIEKDEMVTFNYTTSEFEMNSPFACLCGSAKCSKMIRGFKHLSAADRQRLWPIATEWVKEQAAVLA